MLRKRWNLNAKSRKHPNKPSRGIYKPETDYRLPAHSRRAERQSAVWNRLMKPIESRAQARVIQTVEDKRGQTYARLTTGQILRA